MLLCILLFKMHNPVIIYTEILLYSCMQRFNVQVGDKVLTKTVLAPQMFIFNLQITTFGENEMLPFHH